MKSYLKLMAFYLIGFVVLYLEPIPIAGTTVGIAWKLLLMLLFFFPILYMALEYKKIEVFIVFSILYALKILISYSSFDYPVSTITECTKALMFPMLYLYFIIKVQSETLLFLAKHFAILIVLSFLPYMFGLLKPLGEGYDLSAYGLDSFGLVGVFQNPHSASISLAFAMIIITNNIKRDTTTVEKLFSIGLLFLGAYEILNTYVRTGLMIYIVALLYLYLKNFNLKKMFLLLMTAVTIGGIGVYLFNTNEVVRMRFEDRNKYVEDGGVGSGRFQFWEAAVTNWLNDDTSVIFIGLGIEYGKDKMEEVVGLRIFAHNAFFQALQQEGLIGFSLFIIGLFLLGQFIMQHKHLTHYTVALSMFISMIIMMMFQGGFYFNIIFLLSIYLALLKQQQMQIHYQGHQIPIQERG